MRTYNTIDRSFGCIQNWAHSQKVSFNSVDVFWDDHSNLTNEYFPDIITRRPEIKHEGLSGDLLVIEDRVTELARGRNEVQTQWGSRAVTLFDVVCHDSLCLLMC